MNNIKIIRLSFTSPLHISNVKSDYDISEKTVHSDTFYSAVIEAWSILGLNQYIPKSTNDRIGISISTLYPYVCIKKENKKEYVYFLPRPASFKPDVSISLNKKVKKIEFLDSSFFNEFQENGVINLQESSIKGIFYTDKPVGSNIIQREVMPRVRVPRNAGESKPYYIERIYFRDDAGLYFFVQYESDAVLKAFVSALDYLKEEGIGTDRHVGNGQFNYEMEDDAEIIHFNGIESEYSLNLSLYIPESHDIVKSMIDDKSYFEILTRGGWITTFPYNTLRKKYIRAIKEGSVLKTKPGIYGKIADITPDKGVKDFPVSAQNMHNIYRIGTSFWVPVINN